MSHTVMYQLVCDNCGTSEDSDDGPIEELPEGWEENFDDGDTIFAHVCEQCAADIRNDPDYGLNIEHL